MSAEEQASVTKNLLWEYVCLRKELVCLHNKSISIKKSLQSFTRALETSTIVQGRGSQYPSEAEIHEVLKEIDSAEQAIKSKRQDLVKMGVSFPID